MVGRKLTEAEREAADRARRETVEELHRQLADNIATLDDKDAWQRWLRMAAKLHRITAMAKPIRVPYLSSSLPAPSNPTA